MLLLPCRSRLLGPVVEGGSDGDSLQVGSLAAARTALLLPCTFRREELPAALAGNSPSWRLYGGFHASVFIPRACDAFPSPSCEGSETLFNKETYGDGSLVPDRQDLPGRLGRRLGFLVGLFAAFWLINTLTRVSGIRLEGLWVVERVMVLVSVTRSTLDEALFLQLLSRIAKRSRCDSH
jgi:hypothetical protein